VSQSDPGDKNFGEFVTGSLPALLRFGHVLTGNRQEAEDLVQEALAKSLRRWRRVTADDPRAYVRRVMVNTHQTRWRRWGSRVELGDVLTGGPRMQPGNSGAHRVPVVLVLCPELAGQDRLLVEADGGRADAPGHGGVFQEASRAEHEHLAQQDGHEADVDRLRTYR
jgi:DNA-directed RNA polymerase specialized sigma24 family protein